jgi:hypothetical protein
MIPASALNAWLAAQRSAQPVGWTTPAAAPTVAKIAAASPGIPNIMGSAPGMASAAPSAAPSVASIPNIMGSAPGAVTTATNAAAALGAANTGNAAGKGGLLSRFGKPTLGKGALMRGAGWAGAGLMGGQVVNGFNVGGEGSDTDQALTGLTTGAGIGAGIGSVVPGVGTGVGAVVGGGLGTLIGLFGPKNDPYKGAKKALENTNTRLASMMNIAGLDPFTQQQLYTQYQLAIAAASDEKGRVDKDSILSIDQQMQQAIQGQMLGQQAQTQAQLDQERQVQNNMGLLMMALAGGGGGFRAAQAVPGMQAALEGRLAPLQQMQAQQQQGATDLATLLAQG